MLKNLEIKDFQSHRNTSIEFHPGMNIITGPSDNGKSAIIRAILCGVFNRPSGDAYRSWAADKSSTVEIAFEFDNDWFIKKRIKDKNVYECDEGTYTALRSDVPERIQDIANITDYNVQTQFQKYFMLQDSPGERAKRLNELVGLDIIDRVFKKLNGKITSARQKVTSLNTEIIEVTEDLERLAYLEEVAPLIQKLDADISKHTVAVCRVDLMHSLVSKMTEINELIASHDELLSQEQAFLILSNQISKVTSKERDCLTLDMLVDNLTKIDDQLGDSQYLLEIEAEYNEFDLALNTHAHDKWRVDLLTELITGLKKQEDHIKEDEEWLTVEVGFNALQVNLTNRTNWKRNIQLLGSAIDSLTMNHEDTIAKTTLVDDLTTRYQKLLVDNAICPTCKRPITKEEAKGIDL